MIIQPRFQKRFFMIQIEQYLLMLFTNPRIINIHHRCLLVPLPAIHQHIHHGCLSFVVYWPHFFVHPGMEAVSLPGAMFVVCLFFRLRKVSVKHSYDESLRLPWWWFRFVSPIVIIRIVDCNVDILFWNMLVILRVVEVLNHLPFLWKVAIESICQEFIFFRLNVSISDYWGRDMARALVGSRPQSLSVQIYRWRINGSSHLLPGLIGVQNINFILDGVIWNGFGVAQLLIF